MKENKNSQKEKKTDDKKKCFIIMPITTPEPLSQGYSGDPEHFKHVLDHLFIPAIESAGFQPIPPIAKGSDMIHVEIIKKLEFSDLVLCDMSSLNPNVFFELGIRSALNKPVSHVVDDVTSKPPFDTSIINYHTYKSSLEPWHLQNEIKRLSLHIKESVETSGVTNTMWKNLGISSIARPAEIEEGREAQLSYLIMQVESLKEKIEKRQQPINMASAFSGKFIGVEIIEKAKEMELIPKSIEINDEKKYINLELGRKINPEDMNILSSVAKKHGWNLIIGKWEDEGPL